MFKVLTMLAALGAPGPAPDFSPLAFGAATTDERAKFAVWFAERSRAAAPMKTAQQSGAASNTGIRGRVVRWPVCPVETAGRDCAAKPVSARVVVSRGGQQVATTRSSSDGKFQIAAAPGDYMIEAKVRGMLCKPVDATVPRQGYVQVTLRCDTGIR